MEKGDIIRLFLLGTFGVVGYHFFFFTSLKYTVVANTAIINASTPIITGIMAAIFIRERLTTTNYIGVFIAFAGVLILVTKGKIDNLLGLKFNSGDISMLLAVISWAIYALIVKRLVRRYSGFTVTYYSALFGVLQLIILAMTENPIEQVSIMSTASLISLFYMGIVASGIGYLLYNLSIEKIGPTRTSSFVNSNVPVFVAILAFLFFGEAVTIVMILSAVLIIVGLNFMLREKRTA